MRKRKPNIYVAAVLIQFSRLCGFVRRDPRLSKQTRSSGNALIRGRYRGERKASKAFARWHRSICADARAAGLVPYTVAK
jgi:hypothetical protein